VQTVFDLEGFAGAHASLPFFVERATVIGVDGFDPAVAELFVFRCSGHLVPALVDVSGLSGGIGDPDDLRYGLGQSFKASLIAAGDALAPECCEKNRTGDR